MFTMFASCLTIVAPGIRAHRNYVPINPVKHGSIKRAADSLAFEDWHTAQCPLVIAPCSPVVLLDDDANL
jgi:hypothetical protein